MPTVEMKTKPKMVNITLYIPDQSEDAIQILIKRKLTPNRSEFIRNSIRDFLRIKLPYYKDLESFNEIIASHPFLEEMRRYPTWQK